MAFGLQSRDRRRGAAPVPRFHFNPADYLRARADADSADDAQAFPAGLFDAPPWPVPGAIAPGATQRRAWRREQATAVEERDFYSSGDGLLELYELLAKLKQKAHLKTHDYLRVVDMILGFTDAKGTGTAGLPWAEDGRPFDVEFADLDATRLLIDPKKLMRMLEESGVGSFLLATTTDYEPKGSLGAACSDLGFSHLARVNEAINLCLPQANLEAVCALMEPPTLPAKRGNGGVRTLPHTTNFSRVLEAIVKVGLKQVYVQQHGSKIPVGVETSDETPFGCKGDAAVPVDLNDMLLGSALNGTADVGSDFPFEGLCCFSTGQSLISEGNAVVYPAAIPSQSSIELLCELGRLLDQECDKGGCASSDLRRCFGILREFIDDKERAAASAAGGTVVLTPGFFAACTKAQVGFKGTDLTAKQAKDAKKSPGLAPPMNSGDIEVTSAVIYSGASVHAAKAAQAKFDSFERSFRGAAAELRAHLGQADPGGEESEEKNPHFARDTERHLQAMREVVADMADMPVSQLGGYRIEVTVRFGAGVGLEAVTTTGVRALKYIAQSRDIRLVHASPPKTYLGHCTALLDLAGQSPAPVAAALGQAALSEIAVGVFRHSAGRVISRGGSILAAFISSVVGRYYDDFPESDQGSDSGDDGGGAGAADIEAAKARAASVLARFYHPLPGSTDPKLVLRGVLASLPGDGGGFKETSMVFGPPSVRSRITYTS